VSLLKKNLQPHILNHKTTTNMARTKSTPRFSDEELWKRIKKADEKKNWEKFREIYFSFGGFPEYFQHNFYKQKELWNEWNFMQETPDIELLRELKEWFTSRERQIEAVNECLLDMVKDRHDENKEDTPPPSIDHILETMIRDFELTRDQIYDYLIELYFDIETVTLYTWKSKLAIHYKKEHAFVQTFTESLLFRLKNLHDLLFMKEMHWFLVDNITILDKVFHWSDEAIGRMLKSVVKEEDIQVLKEYIDDEGILVFLN